MKTKQLSLALVVAVSIQVAHIVAAHAESSEVIDVPRLGVTVFTHRIEAKSLLDEQKIRIPRGLGAVVEKVAPRSLSAMAGVQPLDFIFAVNGKRIKSAEHLAILEFEDANLEIRWQRFEQGKWRIFDPDRSEPLQVQEGAQLDPAQTSARTKLKQLKPLDYPLLHTEYVRHKHAVKVFYKYGEDKSVMTVSFLAMEDMPEPDKLTFEIRLHYDGEEIPLFLKKLYFIVDEKEFETIPRYGATSTNKGAGTVTVHRYLTTRSSRYVNHFTICEAIERTSSPVKMRLVGRSSEKIGELTKVEVEGIRQLYKAYKDIGGKVVLPVDKRTQTSESATKRKMFESSSDESSPVTQ